MSTLENGHFAPGSEVDSVDDLLLPPVLRSLKPTTQTIAPPGDDSGDVGGEGESGDDSDEEWNYISGKENREPNQHTKQELTREEMESQLNPNAAEFVPGYGAISPTSDLDIVDISRSPKRSEIKNLDNVVVPTSKEFLKEISKRPSDLDELGENETTLNGGDLNNLSTKAVFGDDSVCHNSVIDSSLQNESLKSTNPFASSQVPNFVQDHFSLPDDSKANDEYDFMGNSGKIDLSPSAPALDVYTSGQTDLTGVTFGDGVNVDEIVRSKQDSPLLRESPEPSLHNGQLEHNYHQKEDDKTQGLQIASVETVRWPSDSQEDVDKQVITNLTTEALMHSDHGPETSVDSESDEDLVLSPKMKENLNISTQLADESVPIEDPVCSLKPSHDTDLIEKSSVPVPQLEEVNVFHKDDEDGEEELTCPNKHHSPENSSNLVPEESVGDAHLSEKVSAVISPDVPSDFEIVHSDNFGCTFQTNNTEMESPKEAGNAVDDLPYHADPVEEIIRKEEVHEDLICPVKESQLLQEDSKEPEQSADEFSFEKIVAEESSTPQGGIKLHELVPELEDVNGKHMNNIFQFQDETMCFRRKDEVEDTCINKEEELMESLEKDELICPKKMEVCRDEQRVAIDSVEEDLVCPIKKDVNDDGAFKNEMHFLSSVTKDLDGLQLKEDKDFDSSNKKEELFCPIEKQDDKFVCQTEKENDLICPDEEKSELVVCPIQKEDELGFSTKKEEDLVCPMNKADFTEYLRKEEDDLTSTLRKEEDDLTSYLRKEEDNLTCSLRKKEDDLTSYLRKEEDVLASSLRKEEDFASSVNKEEDLVCPIIKKEENSLFSIPKEDNIYYHSNQVEDACFFGKDDSLQKNKENVFSVKGDEVLNQELRSSESVQVCSLRSDEESVCPPPNDSVTSQPKEFVSSQNEECVRSFTEEVICSLRKGKDEISNIEDIKPEIQMSQEICEQFSVETQENHEISSEISVKSPLTKDILPEDNLIYSEQSTEESLDNLEEARENKVVKQEESIDEMSSSMIDHGEDKSLPEAQSSQLDLVQDLQFEIQEKAEVDTESDSGFEIINASEASTIEMEMRIQSEKEAGAADEKLHLDKNEAEIPEKVEADVTDRYQSEVIEESGRKDLEPLDTKKAMDEVLVNGSAGTADTPATPPATPAPGLQVESKEGLIAAAVAAAGVATAVAAGSAAVAVTESKVEEKKKPPTPKKAEPLTKSAAPSKAPPSKTLSGKPAAPSKAPAAPSKAPAASKAPSSSLKAAPKPSSPSAKTAPTATKPAPGSKPSTPTSKVAAKPGSKPSTPTGPKPAPATALKSKPATSAPLKSTTASKVGPVGGPKPAPAAATKKPVPTPAPKPTSTASKSAVSSSSVAARPAAKPATESKSVISSTQKSPATKMAPAKPPTPTTGKAPISARPPSAKTAAPSKPPVSSAPSKAPATKPPPIRAPTAKAPSTITAKTTTATKPLAPAKPTAPTKTASAPLNKKPAAPTAIKKPAAPTDKSVKEANNKLASAKTGIKKVDEKKVINKKEEIAENEVLLTQEPVVTTTNGHISLIENGIPSPEIVADSN